jgi:hypothetical protein
MTPRRPPLLQSFGRLPSADAVVWTELPPAEPVRHDTMPVACSQRPETESTLVSRVFDATEPMNVVEPGARRAVDHHRSRVEPPHLIQVSSDGQRAASYSNARPVAARFDTLPSPPRDEVIIERPHYTPSAPCPGPLDATPPATLVDSLPTEDRNADTVPRRRRRRFLSHVLVGLGVFVITLTIALSLSMTWLSRRTRGQSAAASPSTVDVRATVSADPSANMTASAEALPSAQPSALPSPRGAQSPSLGPKPRAR